MKIGILTFHFALNYGAVFQAYALKKALSKMGHDAHIINYRPENMRTTWNFEAYCNLLKNGRSSSKKSNGIKKLILNFLIKINYVKFKLFEYDNLKKKYDLFSQFVNDYLCDDKTIIEKAIELQNQIGYDAILCGSDQIWNPKITGGLDPSYFGAYSPDSVTRIAYAASVGDINIIAKHEKTQKQFMSLVRGMNSVSVREKNLCDYLTYNNIKSEWVLDPTLLLVEDDYDQIVEKRMVKEDYIFIYCLSYDEKLFKAANIISQKNNLRIISVSGTKKQIFSSFQNVTPCVFLSLLKYAKIVITNSFHGTALSIVFHKDFYTVLPPSRKDRLNSLLKQFDLTERIVDNMELNNIKASIDYESIDEKICASRIKSLIFLKNEFATK